MSESQVATSPRSHGGGSARAQSALLSDVAQGIEVLVYRDPDGDTEVTVFLDGQVLAALVEVIDPGAGHCLSDWIDHTSAVATNEAYSPEFQAAVVTVRTTAERRYLGEFVIDSEEG